MGVVISRIRSFLERNGPLGSLKKLSMIPRLLKLLVSEILYQSSLGRETKILPQQVTRQRGEARDFERKPLISVVVPVYKPRLEWLEQCLSSVLGQSYPFLELCVSDDASEDDRVSAYLRRLEAEDPRVKIDLRTRNGHICVNTNAALALATGDYVAFLDHDDVLDPRALFEVASLINRQADLDFIYSDEDKIDEWGNRSEPAAKPEFSRELLYRTMFTGHLSVYRRSLVNELGGLRVGTEGAQDWDLLLRAIELRPLKVSHLPKVLYHWRKHALSTASNPASKPYAHEASYQVLKQHFLRIGQDRQMLRSPAPGFYEWSDPR
jgi:glycosyltransferase involved in cell wall biosynthesis